MSELPKEPQAPDSPIAAADKMKHQSDVIYVLRTTQQHHVMLGMIADQKANIILGVYLIFITATQSLFESHGQYAIPIWVLSAFFTLSAVFALLVIAPRFRSQNPSSGPTSNLLFFGSFTSMQQDEFIDTLKENLQTNDQARTLMMKDIYQIGKVLNKKYRNLRLSYIFIGIGVIATAFSFSLFSLNLL